ncbi:MAG TPA: triose-phosphate isomerase, partial [Clostridia bacterium]|nr:triose-phosphate isomerase [Clostridia bacterium]
PIIAGNWKMNMIRADAAALVQGLGKALEGIENVEVVVCPPFTALDAVAAECAKWGIGLGAQNMHWEASGAFTGEISPVMVKDAGCKYVIIGHSERRQYFGETNDTVNAKIKAALEHELTPIMCVGETLEQREAGVTDRICREQVVEGLKGIDSNLLKDIVVAYEPVWAIGTGKSASAKDAEHVINYIRQVLADLLGTDAAEKIRIQYGGSVKPENTEELMAQPNIDGALVGGASLKAESFAGIISRAAKG